MHVGIIGAGINGAALAYFLQRIDGVDVSVFEKDQLGGFSTSKSVGVVRLHYSNPEQIRFANRGQEILANLTEFIDRDGGFVECGMLAVADATHESAFREVVELQRDCGVDVSLLDRDELADRLPGLARRGLSLGAFEHGAGFADPYQVATGFAATARELGATVRPNRAVQDLVAEAGTVTAVVTADGTHPVDVVVNAAGIWAPAVGRMVGIDLPIEVYELNEAVLRSETAYAPTLPILFDVPAGRMVKPERSGEFVTGLAKRRPTDLADIASPRGMSSDELGGIFEFLDRRLPAYADARLVETWSGFVGMTPDRHHIVGRPAGMDNFYNLVGGSGHGFKEAAGFAESVARDIVGEPPVFDLSRYRLERFDAGEAFENRYSSSEYLA